MKYLLAIRLVDIFVFYTKKDRDLAIKKLKKIEGIEYATTEVEAKKERSSKVKSKRKK